MCVAPVVVALGCTRCGVCGVHVALRPLCTPCVCDVFAQYPRLRHRVYCFPLVIASTHNDSQARSCKSEARHVVCLKLAGQSENDQSCAPCRIPHALTFAIVGPSSGLGLRLSDLHCCTTNNKAATLSWHPVGQARAQPARQSNSSSIVSCKPTNQTKQPCGGALRIKTHTCYRRGCLGGVCDMWDHCYWGVGEGRNGGWGLLSAPPLTHIKHCSSGKKGNLSKRS